MERLKVGVVGTGFVGGRHIDAIARIPQARLAAVVDNCEEKGRQIAEQYGAHYYRTTEEMLEAEELDVVHNCTPTSMHFEIDAQIIRAGKHLYCEKPLTLNAREGQQLTELLKEHPVANGVNLNYRMNALLQDLHDRVKSGELGRSFMVSANYIQDWMMKPDDYDWRLDPQLGGDSRAIADIGSHLFDTTQFVLDQKIVAVNARLLTVHPTRQQYEKTGGTFSKEKGKLLREVPVVNEDAAFIMARFEDGTEGIFQVSQVSAGHKNDMRLRFDFETCSCEWRQEQNDLLYIGRRDEPNQVKYREAPALTSRAAAYTGLPAGHPEGWNDALYQAIRAFYDSILTNGGGVQPYATVEQAAWVMKIIEACLTSHKAGRWVDVKTGEVL